MPYSAGRVVHDADAHIMEPPSWLRDHADPAIRERIEPLRYTSGNELRQTGDPDVQLRDLDSAFDRIRVRHASAEYRVVEEAEIMQRKNFAATGSFGASSTTSLAAACNAVSATSRACGLEAGPPCAWFAELTSASSACTYAVPVCCTWAAAAAMLV